MTPETAQHLKDFGMLGAIESHAEHSDCGLCATFLSEVAASTEPAVSDSDPNAIFPHGVDTDGHCLRCGLEEENATTHECPAGFNSGPAVNGKAPSAGCIKCGGLAACWCRPANTGAPSKDETRTPLNAKGEVAREWKDALAALVPYIESNDGNNRATEYFDKVCDLFRQQEAKTARLSGEIAKAWESEMQMLGEISDWGRLVQSRNEAIDYEQSVNAGLRENTLTPEECADLLDYDVIREAEEMALEPTASAIKKLRRRIAGGESK